MPAGRPSLFAPIGKMGSAGPGPIGIALSRESGRGQRLARGRAGTPGPPGPAIRPRLRAPRHTEEHAAGPRAHGLGPPPGPPPHAPAGPRGADDARRAPAPARPPALAHRRRRGLREALAGPAA